METQNISIDQKKHCRWEGDPPTQLPHPSTPTHIHTHIPIQPHTSPTHPATQSTHPFTPTHTHTPTRKTTHAHLLTNRHTYTHIKHYKYSISFNLRYNRSTKPNL